MSGKTPPDNAGAQSKPQPLPPTSKTRPLPYKPKISPLSSAHANKNPAVPPTPAASPAGTSSSTQPKAKPQSMLGKALRTPSKWRPVLLTVSVAAITAMGAWYGAGLKMEREAKEEREVAVAAGPQERIRRLEEAKARLEGAKGELVGKIDEIRARRAARDESEAGT